MDVLGANYHAARIAEECTAAYWLGRCKEDEQAQSSANFLRKSIEEQFAKLAGDLGYRIEKITEQKDAA